MPTAFNIYCDESCHMEHDRESIMLLGSVWCPRPAVQANSAAIRALKETHRARGELKWVRVSPSRLDYFTEVLEFFFRTPGLNFRCLVVKDKSLLDHSYFNKGSHDSFYYKMYFYLLRNMMQVGDEYNVYIDIKDSRSQLSVATLGDVVSNSFHDFERRMLGRIQQVRSSESELLQLADFLIGAVGYANRNLSTSEAKLSLVERMRERSRLSLLYSTPPWEEKFNRGSPSGDVLSPFPPPTDDNAGRVG